MAGIQQSFTSRFNKTNHSALAISQLANVPEQLPILSRSLSWLVACGCTLTLGPPPETRIAAGITEGVLTCMTVPRQCSSLQTQRLLHRVVNSEACIVDCAGVIRL